MPLEDYCANLKNYFIADFDKNKNKAFKNSLDELLPKKMIPIIIDRSGINTDKKGQMYFRVKQEEFNRLEKLRQSIARTPFEVKDKYPSSMPVDTVINDGIYCLIEPYKLFEIADRLPKNCFKYFLILCKELLPDTNIITLVGTEVAKKYGFDVSHIQNYNAILCDLQVIVRTDVQSTFVINHNIIYKGDLNKFSKNYKEIYNDSVPERINYTKIKLSNKKAYVNKNKTD